MIMNDDGYARWSSSSFTFSAVTNRTVRFPFADSAQQRFLIPPKGTAGTGTSIPLFHRGPIDSIQACVTG